ncbi:MAG: metal ABC transporter ATP-binding protein [Anaerolineales bacterium]|nr:metal ABC transporter ATP-binding protein [Anaerolineales bacterium]
MYPHTHHQADQPVLDVQNLSVRYDGYDALQGVSFHLRPGERVAVVGPNGAGKSTLFKVIAGVLPPTSGEVTVYGSGPRGHICIGYIPQRSQVDWRFPVSVGEVVMMGRSARLGPFAWPSRRDWQQVHTALQTVDLDDLVKRQISELSGGQQQRMFIARALAQEAELMLMDEPISGLDTPAQESLLSLLSKLQEKGVTVMVATHDLQQAGRYFDRIILLNRQLIGFGSAQEVLEPTLLKRAYGDRLRLVEMDGGLAAMDDTCCDGDERHDHAA